MMLALLRREWQEHRSLFTLPAGTGAVLWFLTVGAVMLGDGMRDDGSTLLADIEQLDAFLDGLHSLFLLVMFVFAMNYLQACLYRDRRDNSVLFWKSMPVAEWQEVASKLLFACVMVPLVFLCFSVLTQWITVLTGSLWVGWVEPDSDSLWNRMSLLPLLLSQVVGMLVWTVASLPVYAWVMLVSATVRRSPLMWAGATPVIAYILEGMFFGTTHIAGFIKAHLPLFSGAEILVRELEGLDLAASEGLDAPGLLAGVLLSLPLLALAVWMRKYRFEI